MADLAVFGAYIAIPLALGLFMLRRRDLPFPRTLCLFCLFIFSCGFGHLVEATIFWNPWYRFSAAIKVCTALVSWVTVITLLPLIPKAFALPRLAADNERLQKTISQQLDDEKRLLEQASLLTRLNGELEEFNRHALSREDRVIELKEEVNELLARQGQEPRYSEKVSAG